VRLCGRAQAKRSGGAGQFTSILTAYPSCARIERATRTHRSLPKCGKGQRTRQQAQAVRGRRVAGRQTLLVESELETVLDASLDIGRCQPRQTADGHGRCGLQAPCHVTVHVAGPLNIGHRRTRRNTARYGFQAPCDFTMHETTGAPVATGGPRLMASAVCHPRVYGRPLLRLSERRRRHVKCSLQRLLPRNCRLHVRLGRGLRGRGMSGMAMRGGMRGMCGRRGGMHGMCGIAIC
jgi:hypothetical protein